MFRRSSSGFWTVLINMCKLCRVAVTHHEKSTNNLTASIHRDKTTPHNEVITQHHNKNTSRQDYITRHNEETTKRNEVTTTHNDEATQNNDKQSHKKVLAFHIIPTSRDTI